MPEAETPFALSAFGTSRPFETFVSAALTSQACRPPPPSCHKVYIAPTSDANQEQPSALEHHAYTADNTISLGGIDVEALNALARNVQERLKGGFGDFHEEGSHKDSRTAQLPKLTKLLGEVDRLNDSLLKLVATRASRSNDLPGMTSGAGTTVPLGGKSKTLNTRVQELQHQFAQMMTRNERLEKDVKAATTQAEEATRKMEATKLENETLRKDDEKQGKKLKELERKGPKAVASQDQSPWDEQFQSLQVQVQATADKNKRIEKVLNKAVDDAEQAKTDASTAKVEIDILCNTLNQQGKRLREAESKEPGTTLFTSAFAPSNATHWHDRLNGLQQQIDTAHNNAETGCKEAMVAQAQAQAISAAHDKTRSRHTRAIISMRDQIKKTDERLDLVLGDDSDVGVPLWVPTTFKQRTLECRINKIETYTTRMSRRTPELPAILMWNICPCLSLNNRSKTQLMRSPRTKLSTHRISSTTTTGVKGGTAVVDFKDQTDANEAVRMDGMMIGGQKVSVQEVFYPQDDTIIGHYSGWILLSGGWEGLLGSQPFIPDAVSYIGEPSSTLIREFLHSVANFHGDMKIKMAMDSTDKCCMYVLVKLADEVEVTRAFRMLHGQEFSRGAMHVGIVQGYDGT
ncbi:hypothetical protein CLAFUW4_14750 [Fulvia fulva]|nr:hypothetical protein CLAFUR4_14742 [Fulvia fulva]KAK4609772.1 hypothetical protein CLAFUR0_14742 [Fulvia fulva]WPV22574.1 hypothetical protein CLAFUW4_14750 [Fulvia fulva]WPV37845.1 hypothetical protein CLAFUW7_14751 [Fulvia fulva]